ncbi:MAG: NAD(P)/FAD-dependent oxidoreductase, partial [Clostridia bacterium]|nr:NAD(P)/FAD-dependent oxidoreductase [Clostridia bacterium]
KIYITGKGRCNVTNDCSVEDFLDNVVHGTKFLRSALYTFTPSHTMEMLEKAGLALVTERGNRVFPLSQKSNDVIKTLQKEMERAGVDIRLKTEVKEIRTDGNSFRVYTPWENILCDKVIVATGGVSYPSTGSTGDGYKFAKDLGHKVVGPVPALAPLQTVEDVKCLEGLSLKNVRLTAYNEGGKEIRDDFGEMLFTGRGLSGPIALTISSYINRAEKVRFALDLKPALDHDKLEARVLRDFEERKNLDVKNATRALMPERLNSYVLKVAGIPENKKVNSVTKDERTRLISTLKSLPFTLKRLAPFEEAIVTAGGVDIKDVTPHMESKKHSGLYFVGEVLDVDALTGGFNLQIAFATGYMAAKHATKELGENND